MDDKHSYTAIRGYIDGLRKAGHPWRDQFQTILKDHPGMTEEELEWVAGAPLDDIVGKKVAEILRKAGEL